MDIDAIDNMSDFDSFGAGDDSDDFSPEKEEGIDDFSDDDMAALGKGIKNSHATGAVDQNENRRSKRAAASKPKTWGLLDDELSESDGNSVLDDVDQLVKGIIETRDAKSSSQLSRISMVRSDQTRTASPMGTCTYSLSAYGSVLSVTGPLLDLLEFVTITATVTTIVVTARRRLAAASKMGYCNEILRADNDGEHRQFIRKLQAARDDIVAFVNNLLGWEGAGQYHRWLKGSFNIGYVIKRPDEGVDDGKPSSVFIRFPIPGRTYSPWSAEKVKNEVMILEYLREHTNIPLPRVYSWSLAKDSPWQLAPFILMDFMDGVCLDDLLKKPTQSDDDPLILDPDIDQKKLKHIYSQIADYMLQLSRLQFPSIGAISKDSGRWAVTGRPMTYDMNELVADTGFPASKLSSGPLNRASEYFNQRADELWAHLCTQRNICETKEEVRQRFTARRRLAQLIPKYCIDNDLSFRLFNDDFGPFNMLANPKTFQITAVLDFEFTNAMPVQYLHDVPSWLLLASPHCWLERDDKAGFEKLFVPQMELFIREVERVESTSPPLDSDKLPLRLSALMRESWRSGRFWFNYAMRTSIDTDVIYWKALDDGEGEEMLEKEIEQVVKTKMEQFDVYLKEKENDSRFK